MALALLQAAFFTLFACVVYVQAQASSHTIRFNNQCGTGTPTLIIDGQIVSNGTDYTSSGDALSGIAYLQTGKCGFNGEQCTLIEFTLNNPSCPGCGSSVDISLIPPHAFNMPAAFSYIDGCDGQGATCSTAFCNTAFFTPNDNQVQVGCQTDNVGLLISFCTDGSPPAPSSSSKSKPAIPTTVITASSSAAPTPTVISSAITIPAMPTPSKAATTSAALESVLPMNNATPSEGASTSVHMPNASVSASAPPTRASGKTCRSQSDKKTSRAYRRAHVKHRRASRVYA